MRLSLLEYVLNEFLLLICCRWEWFDRVDNKSLATCDAPENSLLLGVQTIDFRYIHKSFLITYKYSILFVLLAHWNPVVQVYTVYCIYSTVLHNVRTTLYMLTPVAINVKRAIYYQTFLAKNSNLYTECCRADPFSDSSGSRLWLQLQLQV